LNEKLFKTMPKIQENDNVVIVLHTPREKFWGVLRELNAAGVYTRGIDLNAFDEFIRAIRNNEHFYGVTEAFFPMWRVERISRDESSGDIPSMSEQFVERTGKDVISTWDDEPATVS
jgi:hypothetical protein